MVYTNISIVDKIKTNITFNTVEDGLHVNLMEQ